MYNLYIYIFIAVIILITGSAIINNNKRRIYDEDFDYVCIVIVSLVWPIIFLCAIAVLPIILLIQIGKLIGNKIKERDVK